MYTKTIENSDPCNQKQTMACRWNCTQCGRRFLLLVLISKFILCKGARVNGVYANQVLRNVLFSNEITSLLFWTRTPLASFLASPQDKQHEPLKRYFLDP